MAIGIFPFSIAEPKEKSCYKPLRYIPVSSGIDFVNTPRLYSEPPAKRDCQFGLMVCARGSPKLPGLYKETHRNSTNYAREEARTSECLLDRQHLNQLS